MTEVTVLAWDIEAADEYIRYHTLDNEDWFAADEDRKTALLNVASNTLAAKFRTYLNDPDSGIDAIPDEAVYVFAATLAWAYNDTNKMNMQGIASAAIRGMSLTFRDDPRSLYDLIPESVYDMIGIKSSGRRVIPLVI